MAEFKFYFNDKEWQELFAFMQSNNCQIVPDSLYNSEQFHVISDYDDFVDWQNNNTTHFFLVNDTFSFEPLVVSRNKYIIEPKYSVEQRRSGPYLDISYYRGFADTAVIPHKCSYLSYYPNFIHINSSDEFKASEELKLHYKCLVAFIKKKCRAVKKGNKTHFIGYQTFEEIKALL